jgi:hypothetical protein
MTQGITAADIATAAFNLEHLGDEVDHLALIGYCRQELDALEAGMHNQTPEDRVRQNRAWSIQHAAQLEVVKAALAAGVPSDKITAITHRESL